MRTKVDQVCSHQWADYSVYLSAVCLFVLCRCNEEQCVWNYTVPTAGGLFMEPLSDNLIASHPHMNTAPSAFSVSNYLLNTLFLTETSSVPTVLQHDLRSCSCTVEEKTFSIVVKLKTTQATGHRWEGTGTFWFHWFRGQKVSFTCLLHNKYEGSSNWFKNISFCSKLWAVLKVRAARGRPQKLGWKISDSCNLTTSLICV